VISLSVNFWKYWILISIAVPKLEKALFHKCQLSKKCIFTKTQIKSLTLLRLNQKQENRKLAELSTILLILEIEKIKAWQAYQSLNGDIKINGKRKSRLNSKTDKERI